MTDAAMTKSEPARPLMRVEQARQLLAECKRVDEAKEIRDKAEAIRMYLRQQDASREAQNDAAEIKIRAERRLGELLKEQKASGQRAGKGRPEKKSHDATFSTPTLKDLEIKRDAAARWQQIAEVPEEKFETYIQEQRESPAGEITSAGARAAAKSRRVPNASAKTEAPDERYTPRPLISNLHRHHSFTVDAASHPVTPAAQVIGRIWTKEDNGLAQSWKGERVFCNPPFSELEMWVEKADQEVREGGCPLVVMVMPANRTEQPLWQDFIENERDGRGEGLISTRFLDGRTRFGNPANPEGEDVGSPNFACVLVTWSRAAAEEKRSLEDQDDPPRIEGSSEDPKPPVDDGTLCGVYDGKKGDPCFKKQDHEGPHSNGYRTWPNKEKEPAAPVKVPSGDELADILIVGGGYKERVEVIRESKHRKKLRIQATCEANVKVRGAIPPCQVCGVEDGVRFYRLNVEHRGSAGGTGSFGYGLHLCPKDVTLAGVRKALKKRRGAP